MPSTGVARRLSGVWLTCFALLLWGQTTWADAVIVSIEGLDGPMRDNAMNNLSLQMQRERDPSLARIRELHAKGIAEIRTALQPFGYYRAQVSTSLDRGAEGWIARYVVDAGPPMPVRYSDVTVLGEGQNDPAFQKLIEDFPLPPGETLNHALYEDSKRRLQSIALERGYFEMKFTRHQVHIDLENYYADIALTVDTGPRYRFGDVTVEQNILDPKLMDRYVRISPGDPYSTTTLVEIQSALTASDYFSAVDVQADPAKAKDRLVPVHVRLTPDEKNRYTFGIGYGTDTGARGQIGWNRRYINRDGDHARVDLRGSKIERSISASYFIPIRNPRTDQFAISAGYNEGETETAISEMTRFALSRTTSRGRLLETLSLTNQHENFIIGNETGSSSLLLPGVTWTYVLAEDRLYTRIGARVSLDVRGASDKLSSDTSLLQARAQGKAILPLGMVSRFIFRGEIGATSIEEFSDLPASLRFFTGGDASVRGYVYNTLGPIDADGDVIGGRYLLVGSVEYEQRIAGNWAAVLFYDAGNALNDFNDPLRKSAGLGMRWRSPVGQIRLDLAQPLDDPGKSWRVHLNVGPDL